MKVRIIYGGIVSVTCIFAYLIFIDFRDQWKSAEIFRQATYNAPLSMRHLLISPEQLKVKNWQVGDNSVYRLQSNTKNKQLSFEVISRDSKEGDQYWLKTTGLIEFNGVELELWRLLDITNLRHGSEQRGFFFSMGAFPFTLPHINYLQSRVILEKNGNEIVNTPIGNFKCEHYFVYISSPDGKYMPLLELWANPSVRPLGVVRARWKEARLELVQIIKNNSPQIPSMLLEEFHRKSPIGKSCNGCHAKQIGGENVKIESLGRLSATTLDLTDSLFHYRKSKMLKNEALISIQLHGESRRARNRGSMLFSWGKGSFWIKTPEGVPLVISLDPIAHQGNIAIQSSTGRLAVDIQQ